MKTREEFERQCPYCSKGMCKLVADYPGEDNDNYTRKVFKCQNCGQTIWASYPRPVYEPLEDLKAKRGEIALKLNALYNKYYDLRDRTMSPTKEMGIVKEHINKLRKELDKLDKKIYKIRLERKENE